MALEIVGGAAQHEALDGPVAARADDQQVEFVAERGELLAREAVFGARFDALEFRDAVVGLLQQRLEPRAGVAGRELGVGVGRDRHDLERLQLRAADGREFATDRERIFRLGRLVVGNADAALRALPGSAWWT